MKFTALILVLAMAVWLTGCTQKDSVQSNANGNMEVVSAGDDSAAIGAALAEEAIAQKTETDEKGKQDEQNGDTPREINIDLSVLSGTVVYSQVYKMMTEPDFFLDLVIKARGALSYYKDPNTQKEYFAVLVSDATACCAQGIEFIRAGEYAYPEDYPELGTEVEVTGVFDVYEENGYRYIQLLDADLTW